jgi:hypothetical protein
VSYPPYPPDPNRPQDTPREQPGQYPGSTPPPSFPTYGRPEEPARRQNPYDRPQDPAAPFVPPSSPVQGSPYQLPPPPPPYQGPPQYPGAQYPQFGYGYGYQAVQQVRTNGLATAALVCGLVAIFFWIVAPVAIGLGIAALVQIKRRRESGTAQAVVGLSLGSLISLVGAVILVFMFAIDWTGSGNDYGSDEPVATYAPTSTDPDQVYVDDLIVGECFDEGVGDGEVTRQPCPVDHEGELIANVTLPAGAYPGDAKVKDSARRACRTEFAKYVGIPLEKSERKSSYWWPDEDLWNDGDHVVVCAVEASTGDTLHGSVKGTKR